MKLDQVYTILDEAFAVYIVDENGIGSIGYQTLSDYDYKLDNDQFMYVWWMYNETGPQCSAKFSSRGNETPLVEDDDDGLMVIHLVDIEGEEFLITPLVALKFQS